MTDDDHANTDIRNYSFRIGDRLHKRLTNHIHILKKFESRSHTIRRWLEEAAQEKLEMEEELGEELVQRDKFISFKMHTHFAKRIDQRVKIAKQFRISYSTKQWLQEAIEEKLEREEEKTRKLLLHLRDQSKEPQRS